MLDRFYRHLDAPTKLTLVDVAYNAALRGMLVSAIEDAKGSLIYLSPGSDTTQFMLDFALAQQRYNDLQSLLEFLDTLVRDFDKQLGEHADETS